MRKPTGKSRGLEAGRWGIEGPPFRGVSCDYNTQHSDFADKLRMRPMQINFQHFPTRLNFLHAAKKKKIEPYDNKHN